MSNERSKCLITLDKLKVIAKHTLTCDEPSSDIYLNPDYNVVLASNLEFYKEVAKITRRLNPIGISQMAKDRWRLNGTQSAMYGRAIAHAYNNAIQAGKRAPTGEKLHAAVVTICNIALGGKLPGVKQEHAVKTERRMKKEPVSPAKVKRSHDDTDCIMSPNKLMAFYGMSSSSSSSSGPISVKDFFIIPKKHNSNQTGACS